MIRYLEPLERIEDFKNLNDFLECNLNRDSDLKYLSYSMIGFDRPTIEDLTRSHRKNGLEYIGYIQDDRLNGIAAIKSDRLQGFELFLLIIEQDQRQRGIGGKLVEACLNQARQAGYHSMDASVMADNKRMLRLLITYDFIPIQIIPHARADGMES